MLFCLFVFKFILVKKKKKNFFGYTMVVVLMKEVRLIVAMDDLDFKIKDVTFEAKVFNMYGTSY